MKHNGNNKENHVDRFLEVDDIPQNGGASKVKTGQLQYLGPLFGAKVMVACIDLWKLTWHIIIIMVWCLFCNSSDLTDEDRSSVN